MQTTGLEPTCFLIANPKFLIRSQGFGLKDYYVPLSLLCRGPVSFKCKIFIHPLNFWPLGQGNSSLLASQRPVFFRLAKQMISCFLIFNKMLTVHFTEFSSIISFDFVLLLYVPWCKFASSSLCLLSKCGKWK